MAISTEAPVRRPRRPLFVPRSIAGSSRPARIALGFVGPLLILAAWWIVGAAEVVSQTILPTPAQVAESLSDLVTSGNLAEYLGVSMRRVLLGFLLGTAAGVLVAFLTGLSRAADVVITPLISGAYTLPKLAMLPLFILWLGIGEEPKIALIALGAFFPVVVNAYAGIKQTEPNLVLAARNLGAGRAAIARKVYLPSALPYLVAGMRLGFGQSLLLVVAAEMIAGNSGIGYAVLSAGNLMDTPRVMALLVVFGLLGIISTAALRWIERAACPWSVDARRA